jgi:hypothetical protein
MNSERMLSYLFVLRLCKCLPGHSAALMQHICSAQTHFFQTSFMYASFDELTPHATHSTTAHVLTRLCRGVITVSSGARFLASGLVTVTWTRVGATPLLSHFFTLSVI